MRDSCRIAPVIAASCNRINAQNSSRSYFWLNNNRSCSSHSIDSTPDCNACSTTAQIPICITSKRD
jgi:hypothetical protein